MENENTKEWVISYDPALVCSVCRTNQSVHYSYTCIHGGDAVRDDKFGEIGAWCDVCESEAEMVKPGNQ